MKQILFENDRKDVESLLRGSNKFEESSEDALTNRAETLASVREFSANLKKIIPEISSGTKAEENESREDWHIIEELLEQELRLRPKEDWSTKLTFFTDCLKHGKIVV